MSIKLMGSILIIGASAGVSVCIVAGERRKLKEIDLFLELLWHVFDEIRYTRIPLYDIIKKLSGKCKIPPLVQYVRLYDFFDSEKFNQTILNGALDLSAAKEVENYFKNAGRGDIDAEQENYLHCRERLLSYKAKRVERFTKSQRLWAAVPLCCGICVVLLVV